MGPESSSSSVQVDPDHPQDGASDVVPTDQGQNERIIKEKTDSSNLVFQIQQSWASTNRNFTASGGQPWDVTLFLSARRQEESYQDMLQRQWYGLVEQTTKKIQPTTAGLSSMSQAATHHHKDDHEEEEKTSEWWQRLWQLHTEPSRFYHTAAHLVEMFHLLHLITTHHHPPGPARPDDPPKTVQIGDDPGDADSLRFSKEELLVIQWSIFFHDAIYQATSSTNEEDSARLFEQCAAEFALPRSWTDQVVRFILATKNHQAPLPLLEEDLTPSSSTGALAIFLDLDMAVLGKQREAYMHYAALIRQEYAWVPAATYCEKRAEFLQGCVDRTLAFFTTEPSLSSSSASPLFATPLMQQALLNRALSNLQAEIQLLLQGIIPAVDP